MLKKILLILFTVALIGIVVWNVYRIHFVPKQDSIRMVYYNNTLLREKNVVARKNDDTGLQLEYMGTVNLLAPSTEKPDTEFECNSKFFMGAKFYCDKYGNYYLCRTNGDLLLLETSGVGRDALITPSKIRSN